MNVSKPVVYAAGLTILALVATVFFLLGRESTHRRAAANAATTAAIAPAPTTTAPPLPPMPDNARGEAPTPPPPEPPALPHVVTPAPLPPVVATGAPPVAPAGGEDVAAVRDYFAKMAAIQEVAPSADTGEFANKILTGMMQGDSSAFDGLISLAEDGAKRAAAITPPPCCTAYHQHLLAVLGDSMQLMKQLKPAIASSDTTALMSLQSTGNAIKAKTDQLDAEARAIKQRYGLPN